MSHLLQISDNEDIERQTSRMPYIVISEQPTSEAFRFRYKREMKYRLTGIPGINSTQNDKTYPTIKIMEYDGSAVVVASCVTLNKPYMPHPFNLTGNYCNQGICTVYTKDISEKEKNVVVFSNLNIECVKRQNMEESLDVREKLHVDPFKTGFGHKNDKDSINFSAVRLCFQVFVEGSQEGKFNVPLLPVVSNPVYNQKVCYDLVIRTLCQYSASVAGDNIILLCEKVAKDDIQIKFFEKRNETICWEGYAAFDRDDVHKQTAIKFKTPKYYKQDLEEPVQVYIQLRRPSDGATSDPLPFQLLPLFADDINALSRKRKKLNQNPSQILSQYMTNISKRSNATHSGNENNNIEIDVNKNLHGNLDILGNDSSSAILAKDSLPPVQSIKSSTIQENSDMRFLKQQSSKPTLSSVVSNYNNHLIMPHEGDIVQTQQWNLIGTNDQCFPCIPGVSHLEQGKTDALNALVDKIMPECQYEKSLEAASNNPLDIITSTDALNTDDFMNLMNPSFDKEQFSPMSISNIIKTIMDETLETTDNM